MKAMPRAREQRRRQDVPADDRGRETAVLLLDADRFGAEALAGPDRFSHPEVVHRFDRVPVERIETGARHPRGTTDRPLVGVFARRPAEFGPQGPTNQPPWATEIMRDHD
jgi:tRNA (Thr-GGU) A37 N-methylase